MDEVFDSVVKPCANDGLVRMCCSGEFSEMSAETLSETASVPRTNVGTERDFGMFDRLLRENPRATYAIESIIMCRRKSD